MEDPTIAPATIVPAPPAPVDAATAVEQFTALLTNNGWQELHRYTDRTLIGVCSRNGHGHYKYVAEAGLLANSNDTAIDVWRYKPDGSLDAHISIPFPTEAGAAFKGEAGDLWLEIEGPDLVLYLAFHLAIQGVRPGVSAIYALRGFVRDPYPEGQEPTGASFELAGLPGAGGGGEPQPPTGLSDADFTRIQTMLDTKFSLLVTAFGGSSVRDGIQQKVEDALVWLFNAPDTDPRILVARAFRDAFYGQETNIAWAQEWKVAIESGQVSPSLAPPPIRALAGFPWGQGTEGATGEHTNAQELEGK